MTDIFVIFLSTDEKHLVSWNVALPVCRIIVETSVRDQPHVSFYTAES